MLALVSSYYDKLLIVGGTLLSNLITANFFLIFTWIGIQHINTVSWPVLCISELVQSFSVFTSDNVGSDVVSGKWQNTEFTEDFPNNTHLLASAITYARYHEHTPVCRLLQ
jgi:hypothetical protein